MGTLGVEFAWGWFPLKFQKQTTRSTEDTELSHRYTAHHSARATHFVKKSYCQETLWICNDCSGVRCKEWGGGEIIKPHFTAERIQQA